MSVRKISAKLNQYFFQRFTFFSLLLGASACLKLNQVEEAITWCDEGLSVSFIIFYLCPTQQLNYHMEKT